MIETRLTKLLGVRHPIVCGTMHLVTGPEMVAAVANAGALGVLYTSGHQTSAELRDDLRRVKALTDEPFAANVNLFPTTRPASIEEFIEIMHAEGVAVIETSGRNPREYAGRIKNGGAVFMHKVARVRDGVKAAGLGADVVEIVGYESGGHPGEEDITLLIQTQSLVRAVDVPVVPAGGVVDGRGLLAMLALGAEGVCMGTRFMATKESPVHENVKQWLLHAGEADTVLVERSLGNSMRVAKTTEALQVLRMEQEGADIDRLLTVIDGSLAREALIGGRLATAGVVSVGQSAALIGEIPSVQELIDRIIAEAEAAYRKLGTALRQEQQD
jgi:nitronate monooxygenase